MSEGKTPMPPHVRDKVYCRKCGRPLYECDGEECDGGCSTATDDINDRNAAGIHQAARGIGGANSTQIGGAHYKGPYQHWDFVDDVGLDYLTGCASKYLTRWQQKNGVEDLEKARHYLAKRSEREEDLMRVAEFAHLWRFAAANDLGFHETSAIGCMMNHSWSEAIQHVDILIKWNSPKSTIDTRASPNVGGGVRRDFSR